ncbi:Fc.00g096970.m01.CDS01 [Cosmosporella sp. VM-42]
MIIIEIAEMLTFLDAVDMDIFGAFQLCAIGILAAPITVMFSQTYFNDPGRNTIFLWAFLLLVSLICMAVEFYQIDTVDCLYSNSGDPVSSNAAEFPYMEGNNCGLVCSVENGPRSPMRGGSADNIYVIPAPETLTFGTSTLLASACCVHAILCLVSMWDKVLEINWKKRFGRQEEQTHGSNEIISGTNGATKGIMKNVNDTIGFFLKILAIPLFGGAGLAILIVGEINFFSRQVYYQTEPMANVGQWAPVVGTALVMLGSLYLLLARDAMDVKGSSSPCPSAHHGSCCHNRHDHGSFQSTPFHSESNLSTPNHDHIENASGNVPRVAAEDDQSALARNESLRRHSSLSHSDNVSSLAEPSANHPDLGYRRRVAKLFIQIGDFIGTPADDFIEQPKTEEQRRFHFPTVPGEVNRNRNMYGIVNEEEQQQRTSEHEDSPAGSRAGSFVDSIASGQNLTRSTSMPTSSQAPRIPRPRSSTLSRIQSTPMELGSLAPPSPRNSTTHPPQPDSNTLKVPSQVRYPP